MHSDWLKLVVRFATSSHSAFFRVLYSYATLKLVYDVNSHIGIKSLEQLLLLVVLESTTT